jgi:hypothetical protein
MVKIVADAALADKLHDVLAPVEICDRSGRTLGYYSPAPAAAGEPDTRHRSPHSIEELQLLRQQRTGRPLSEILKRLQGP